MDHNLNKAFTGSSSEVTLLQVELQQNGILSQARGRNGLNGHKKMNGGSHSLMDLFIEETDIKKAGPVIIKFLHEQE
jgi:hypothetical protein